MSGRCLKCVEFVEWILQRRIIFRFMTKQTVMFTQWKNYPDLDDSLDSTYRDSMNTVTEEAYQVGLVFGNKD